MQKIQDYLLKLATITSALSLTQQNGSHDKVSTGENGTEFYLCLSRGKISSAYHDSCRSNGNNKHLNQMSE